MVLVTFAKTKVTRPSGRNQDRQRQNAVVATRFKAQRLHISTAHIQVAAAGCEWRCVRYTAFVAVVTSDNAYKINSCQRLGYF
jgi:rRNA maturation endonuclease Nob1